MGANHAYEISQDDHKELRRYLGTWLKKKRDEAGLTQTELAKKLGLKLHTSVSQVENGIGRIPQSLYHRWAFELGIDAEVFAITVIEHMEPGLYAMMGNRSKCCKPLSERDDLDDLA